jgi:hypothetical protein
VVLAHAVSDVANDEAVAALEDDGLEPGASAVRCGDEPVVTAADDRDVVGVEARQRRFRRFACFGWNGAPTTYAPRRESDVSTSSQPIGVNAPQSCGRES